MKFFSDKWDYWHFFGQILLGAIAVLMVAFHHVVAEISFVLLLLLFIFGFILWEKWDKYKVLWNDPRVKAWTKFQRYIFTSEGKMSTKDIKEGFTGLFIGIALMAIILYFLL